MLRRLWRFAAPVAAFALFGLAPSLSRANTIAAVLTGITPSGSNWSFNYDIVLSNLSGISKDASWQSGLVILDLGGFVSAGLSSSGGDATTSTASDWLVTSTPTGPDSLTNADYNVTLAGQTTLKGTNPANSASAPDNGATNLILKYLGGTTGDLVVSASSRVLTHLSIVSSISFSSKVNSISRDTSGTVGSLGTSFSTENHLIDAPSAVPLPPAVWAGMSLMGLMGIKGFRRQRLIKSAD